MQSNTAGTMLGHGSSFSRLHRDMCRLGGTCFLRREHDGVAVSRHNQAAMLRSSMSMALHLPTRVELPIFASPTLLYCWLGMATAALPGPYPHAGATALIMGTIPFTFFFHLRLSQLHAISVFVR